MTGHRSRGAAPVGPAQRVVTSTERLLPDLDVDRMAATWSTDAAESGGGSAELDRLVRLGADRVGVPATPTLEAIYDRVGFVSLPCSVLATREVVLVLARGRIDWSRSPSTTARGRAAQAAQSQDDQEYADDHGTDKGPDPAPRRRGCG